MTFFTKALSAAETQDILQHLIAPRPIALASTIDEEGNVNLSPFSFFNLFSCNPPIIIFSPSRRLRNNTTKHTLDNIRLVPEVAISIVTHNIVHQASLTGCEYARGTDEFIKAGFTKKSSTVIAPPMVAESVASIECSVSEIKSLGENGGAGQLVIAEVLCIHVDDNICINEKKIDQQKIRHVARMGADWYASISPDNLFRVSKRGGHPGIGIDALPQAIRSSGVLTGNDLAQLASVAFKPKKKNAYKDERLQALLTYFRNEATLTSRIHTYAKELIDENNLEDAWQVLLHASDHKEKFVVKPTGT